MFKMLSTSGECSPLRYFLLAEHAQNAEDARVRIQTLRVQPKCREATATTISSSSNGRAGGWPVPTRSVAKRHATGDGSAG